MRHESVLLHESIEVLNLQPGKNVIDGTLGDGGHSAAILKKTAPRGLVLGIDLDPESLLRAKKFLYDYGDRVMYLRDSFANLKEIVAAQGFGPVHGILIDLGWSSPQFEERGRGFSFQKPNEPLDMRYSGGNNGGRTAELILNESSEEELERIMRVYGEEKFAKHIAGRIVEMRQEKRLQTVQDLVNIILDIYREKLKSKAEIPWVGGLHPATKVFQALRIAVNNEYEAIEKAIPEAIDVLASGGRLAMITFHSGEDRIVKHLFKSFQTKKQVHVVTKKPIVPSEKEWGENPRARSAKLRCIEKI